MERINRDHYRLLSGRDVYANHGLIGIADQRGKKQYGEPGAEGFEISEGYDGRLSVEGLDWISDPPPDAWSSADKVELAEFMIAQWQAFKASVRD